ncbi:MAG: helix-turn-helix domain-containing protein [Acidimicrobiia bacterium]|nr:helix-turn-helix domain-containing protein [Acidimicrobiia bacterium]
MAHRVATLVLPRVNPFELAISCEVFGLERPELGVEWYEHVVCTSEGAPVLTNGGFTLQSDHGLEAVEEADTIVVPATPSLDTALSPKVLEALARADERGARLMSFCSGAFALAQAGVLSGRAATTHWVYAGELARRFPDVDVRPDVLYVDAGNVLTSAGTAAGIDLALYVVRRDHGADVANAVARRMVVPPHRDGGQAQFVTQPVPVTTEYGHLGATLDWMIAHLHEPLTIEAMANYAMLSPRTFARRFRDVTGATPHDWLIARRVQHAQRLLEASALSIDLVAQVSGLGSAANLRLHFRRLLGTSPTSYRRAFRGTA